MPPCPEASSRSECDNTAGFTVTEMLVAMMLLTIGALAIFHSMGASSVLAENSDRHSTATQLTASELEKARAISYNKLAMQLATAGTTYFEGATQVTDAASGRVIPSSSVVIDGVAYKVHRYVTWRSTTVNARTVTQAYKQVTVIVSWADTSGTHDVRSDYAVSKTLAPSSSENLALRSTPTMSSEQSPPHPASKLIDGITSGSTINLAHTKSETNPWFAFDLTASAVITEISLWNRSNCCADRATNLWIFVSDTPISDSLATAKSSGAASFNIPGQVGRPSTVVVNSTGRYVKVFLEGKDFLHLSEVQIMGTFR